MICGLAIVALIALLVLQATTEAKFLGGYVTATDSALVKFLLAGSLNIGLFVIALVSAYIGISDGRSGGSHSYGSHTPARL
jgi:hypothetical protein